jgi:hypothetical protein
MENNAPQSPGTLLEDAEHLRVAVSGWVAEHPLTALLVAGALGAAAGALLSRPSAMRGPAHVHPAAGHAAAEAPGTVPPPPPVDWHHLVGVAGALLGAAAATWHRGSAAASPPDPVADLADTDAFAQAPSVPPDA